MSLTSGSFFGLLGYPFDIIDKAIRKTNQNYMDQKNVQYTYASIFRCVASFLGDKTKEIV